MASKNWIDIKSLEELNNEVMKRTKKSIGYRKKSPDCTYWTWYISVSSKKEFTWT